MTPSQLIEGQFEMQTRLFSNALENLGTDQTTRPTNSTNHLAWLAGHLVSTRYMLLGLLGGTADEPHPELYAQGKAIDESLPYPTLEQSIADWNEVTPSFMEALSNVNEETLSAKAPFPVPLGEKIGEVVAFFAHHEAYHIGQMGILRKYFGKEAMKYN